MANQRNIKSFDSFYTESKQYYEALGFITPFYLLKVLQTYLAIYVANPDKQAIIQKEIGEQNPRIAQADLLLGIESQVKEIRELEKALAQSPQERYKQQLLHDLKRQFESLYFGLNPHMLSKIKNAFSLIRNLQNQENNADIESFLKVNMIDKALYSYDNDEALTQKLQRINQSNYVNLTRKTLTILKRYRLQLEVQANRFKTFAKTFSVDLGLKKNDIKALLAQAKEATSTKALNEVTEKVINNKNELWSSAQKQLTDYTAQRTVVSNIVHYMGDLLKKSETILPETIYARYKQRYDALNIQALIENLEKVEKTNDPVFPNPIEDLKESCKYYDELQTLEDKKQTELAKAEREQARRQTEVTIKNAEIEIASSNNKIEILSQSIDHIGHRLNTAELIKTAYSRFSIEAFNKPLAKEVERINQSITNSLSNLNLSIDTDFEVDEGLLRELQEKSSHLKAQMETLKTKIKKYQNLLGVDRIKLSPKQFPEWQEHLAMILSQATDSQLDFYYHLISLISTLNNEYLRGMLIVKFPVLRTRLSEDLLSTMRSWETTYPDRQAVLAVFDLLKMKISDDAVTKVAPHLAKSKLEETNPEASVQKKKKKLLGRLKRDES
ncbi:MAG: hypothetical protein ACE365_01445 [Gammaproteobacteria bacterium]